MNRQSTTVQGSHFHFPNPILARLTKRIGWELVRSTNAGRCAPRSVHWDVGLPSTCPPVAFDFLVILSCFENSFLPYLSLRIAPD